MRVNKVKLGLDIHGVLDADPLFFKSLCMTLVSQGAEVHLVTGAMRNSELCIDLLKMGFLEGVHYTHFFSIADYHSELGTEMWFDKKGRPYINDDDWNVTKGFYAQRVGLTEHWDDSIEYEESFKKNSRCLFLMYSFERCLEFYKDLERLRGYRLALFGGAFNPPHLAHYKLAETVQEYVDKLLILPSFYHREKSIKKESFEIRYPLCQIHFESLSKTEVSSIEKDLSHYIDESDNENLLKGVGSTYELVTFIKESWDFESCDLELFFVLGEDNLNGIDNWYKSEALIKNVHFISFPRSTGDKLEKHDRVMWYEQKGNIHLSTFKLMNISSSEIRNGLNQGENMDFQLGSKTSEWIKSKGLY